MCSLLASLQDSSNAKGVLSEINLLAKRNLGYVLPPEFSWEFGEIHQGKGGRRLNLFGECRNSVIENFVKERSWEPFDVQSSEIQETLQCRTRTGYMRNTKSFTIFLVERGATNREATSSYWVVALVSE